MSDTQKQQMTIKIFKYQGMRGRILLEGNRKYFLEIKEMTTVIDVTDVSTDQLKDTGKTVTLTWWDTL